MEQMFPKPDIKSVKVPSNILNIIRQTDSFPNMIYTSLVKPVHFQNIKNI